MFIEAPDEGHLWQGLVTGSLNAPYAPETLPSTRQVNQTEIRTRESRPYAIALRVRHCSGDGVSAVVTAEPTEPYHSVLEPTANSGVVQDTGGAKSTCNPVLGAPSSPHGADTSKGRDGVHSRAGCLGLDGFSGTQCPPVGDKGCEEPDPPRTFLTL